MVVEQDYVRNLAKHLEESTISADLVIKHGDKTWTTYKLLASGQSDWFKNAMRDGVYEESKNDAVTLVDEPSFQYAIDSMIRFFSECRYTIPDSMSPAYAHSSIAVIADKYQCTALFQFAKSKLATLIKDRDANITPDKWIEAASVVYDHLTAAITEHVEIREIVLEPLWSSSSPISLHAMLRLDTFQDFLRTHADAGSDILVCGRDGPNNKRREVITKCSSSSCGYFHFGDRNCAIVPGESDRSETDEERVCQGCQRKHDHPAGNDHDREITCPLSGHTLHQVELTTKCEGCMMGKFCR